MEAQHKRSTFTGSIGFVLAAAGSAVGLGNIWRFPYLAAKDGGGVFLLCYVILALTFGFTLLTTEIAIGRKTGQSPLTAYGKLSKRWGWIGVLACIIPMLILPYYSAIGGWVLKYLSVYLTGGGAAAAGDSYFKAFTADLWSPIIWFVIFLGATMLVVYKGVDNTDAAGTTRTGWEGFLIYVVPDFSGMTVSKFVVILMDAMGQLFYSISVAMGIMIAYGSYVKKDTNLVKSVNQIEIFDTVVAFLAGLMIVPAVYTFMGVEGMSTGPSLMFKSLPKVGRWGP